MRAEQAGSAFLMFRIVSVGYSFLYLIVKRDVYFSDQGHHRFAFQAYGADTSGWIH